MSSYSISHWMDIWLTDFCDSNYVLILILFWSPSVRRSATHSCGCLWYLSRRPFLLLLTFISLIFLSVSLFYVIWVVSKTLENRSLIRFSQEIPGHLICGAQFHWHISYLNPVSYKKYLMFMCLVWLLLDDLSNFSRRIGLLLPWYMIFSVIP